MPDLKGIAHFSIPVSDVDRSTKFYTEIVGCKFLAQRPDKGITFLDAGGVCVLLIKRSAPIIKGPLDMSDGVHHAFMVDAAEYQAAVDGLRAKGVDVFFEEDRRGGTIDGPRAYFRDPDGTALEFINRTAYVVDKQENDHNSLKARTAGAVCYDLKPKTAGPLSAHGSPRDRPKQGGPGERDETSVVPTADGERGVCSGRGSNTSNVGAEQPCAIQGHRGRQSGVAARPGDRPAHHRQGRGPAAAEDWPDRRESLDDAALHRPGAARAGRIHRDRLRHRARASTAAPRAAERRRARGRAEGRLPHAASRRGRRRQGGLERSPHRRVEPAPMASPGATATSWLRTRTAFGASRTSSGHCAQGAAPSSRRSRTSLLSSASRPPPSLARR